MLQKLAFLLTLLFGGLALLGFNHQWLAYLFLIFAALLGLHILLGDIIWPRFKRFRRSHQRIEPELKDKLAPKLTVEKQVFEHRDIQTGTAYNIKVVNIGIDIHNAVGNLVELALLYQSESLDISRTRYARGYLLWSRSSRTSPDNPISTTIHDNIPAYIDVILRRIGGYKLRDRGNSEFLVAYAEHETRFSNPPPSYLPILLLINIKGDEGSPVYVVCQFDTTESLELVHTGEFDEGGWERIETQSNPHLQVLDVCTKRPDLANYQRQAVDKESSLSQ